MTSIDQFSLTTVPIEQYFNNTLLGSATGFMWQMGRQHFLVTNWHVVTCRVFPTGEYIKSHGGRPNRLHVRFNFGEQIFEKQAYDIQIRNGDDKPLWLVHPFRKIDVAVIPITLSGEQLAVVNLRPINTLTSTDLAVFIGLDVFVLGYPFGAGPPGYPIWKRGSIASEPDLAAITDGYILVDTASRPGMSGAPVILRSLSNHLMADGSTLPLSNKPLTRFIGIYSGRLHTKNASEAQIGMVWLPHYIEQIIAANKYDED